MSTLKTIYEEAAKAAFEAGVSAGDENQLVAWLRANVKYRPETEYFLVLGIGSELADLEAQKQGFRNQSHRAYGSAQAALEARTA